MDQYWSGKNIVAWSVESTSFYQYLFKFNEFSIVSIDFPTLGQCYIIVLRVTSELFPDFYWKHKNRTPTSPSREKWWQRYQRSPHPVQWYTFKKVIRLHNWHQKWWYNHGGRYNWVKNKIYFFNLLCFRCGLACFLLVHLFPFSDRLISKFSLPSSMRWSLSFFQNNLLTLATSSVL